MSDISNIICVDGMVENNTQSAKTLIDALQRKNIIQRDLTDCVLGGLGYAKGKKFSKTVQFPKEGEGLSLNGVKVCLKPTTYYTGEINPEFEVICPNCNQDWFKGISVADFYMEKLSREQLQSYNNFVVPLYAYDGTPYVLKCPHCDEDNEMTRYDYKGQLSFSNLALEFYNWGDFKSEFISKVEKITGHKVSIYFRSY